MRSIVVVEHFTMSHCVIMMKNIIKAPPAALPEPQADLRESVQLVPLPEEHR